MNEIYSSKYQQIDHDNLNKPMSELICPKCEAKDAKRDDSTDHPGCFECDVCHHGFMA